MLETHGNSTLLLKLTTIIYFSFIFYQKNVISGSIVQVGVCTEMLTWPGRPSGTKTSVLMDHAGVKEDGRAYLISGLDTTRHVYFKTQIIIIETAHAIQEQCYTLVIHQGTNEASWQIISCQKDVKGTQIHKLNVSMNQLMLLLMLRRFLLHAQLLLVLR